MRTDRRVGLPATAPWTQNALLPYDGSGGRRRSREKNESSGEGHQVCDGYFPPKSSLQLSLATPQFMQGLPNVRNLLGVLVAPRFLEETFVVPDGLLLVAGLLVKQSQIE